MIYKNKFICIKTEDLPLSCIILKRVKTGRLDHKNAPVMQEAAGGTDGGSIPKPG
jgi:hypothetical protein